MMYTKKVSLIILLLVFSSFSGSLKAQGQDLLIEVSLLGPIKNLNEALSGAYLNIKKNPGIKEVHIVLREGNYPIRESILLKEGETWDSSVKLHIRAYEGEKVVLHGGIHIPLESLSEVRDSAWRTRFSPSVRNKIKVIDLQKANITNLGTLRPVGFSRPYGPAWMELFLNGIPGHLARWPNQGTVPIDSVIDPGSIPRDNDFSDRGGVFTYPENMNQPKRWKQVDQAWLTGYFKHGYAEDAVPFKHIDTLQHTITTALPTMYGFGSGEPWQSWYAYNIPEEIDSEGEFYTDLVGQKLYFLPPDDLQEVELSVLEDPFFRLEGVNAVKISGLQLTCSRGMGIYMERTQKVLVSDCTFSNLGMMAVVIGKGIEPFQELRHEGTGTPASAIVGSLGQHIYENQTYNQDGGFGNGIVNCDIYQTGAGGIILGGGDRITLESAGNFVENCRIRDFNRLERSYRAGVWVLGVGNRVAHTEISDAPALALWLHGNNHLIEYNEIHHVVMENDDMGALYYGRNPSERGHQVRYNYFHHIGTPEYRTTAIYHDDGACGMSVYGNVFYKAGSLFGAGFIGGGSDNVYSDNIFIDCQHVVKVDNRLSNWLAGNLEPGGLFEKRLQEVSFDTDEYARQYPELTTYWDNPKLPKGNIISGNLIVNTQELIKGDAELLVFREDNVQVTGDPGFENYAQEDFRLKKDAAILNKLPTLGQIDFEKMGIKQKKRETGSL